MPVISVRLTDADHAALKQRAGRGRGALSRHIRRRLIQPSTTVAVTFAAPTTTTAGPSFVEWMTGQIGNTITLRRTL